MLCYEKGCVMRGGNEGGGVMRGYVMCFVLTCLSHLDRQ